MIESKEVSYEHRAGYTLLISSVTRPAGSNQRSTCHVSLVLGMQLDASCLSQTQQDVVSAAPTKCPTVIRTVDTIPSFVNSSHIGWADNLGKEYRNSSPCSLHWIRALHVMFFLGTSRRRFPPMVLSALWQKLFWLIWITAPGLVAQLFLLRLKRLVSYYGLHSVPSLPCAKHWWFVNLIFRLHNLLDKEVAIFFLTAVLYFCQFLLHIVR